MDEQIAKRRRNRGPNKPKTPLGKDTPDAAFRDLPETEADVRAGVPLDEESARVQAQHYETMTRKARGEKNAPWNPDSRVRYHECVKFNPAARVVFKQVEPHEAEVPNAGIAVSAVRDYDDVIRHLQRFWRGDHAAFKWTIKDDRTPSLATGVIRFAEKEKDMSQQQPPQGPPPGYAPPPMYAAPQPYWDGRQWVYPQQPPPYYAPPPQYPPSAPQQPPPQAAPPQAAPPPAAPPSGPAMPPMSLAGPDPNTTYLFDEIRRLHSMLEQQRTQAPPPMPHQSQPQTPPPGWYNNQGQTQWWDGRAWGALQQPAQQQQQPTQAAPAQPERPLTPIESAKQAMDTVMQLARLSSDLKTQIADPPAPLEEPETTPATPEEPFPMRIEDLGPFRMAAIRHGDGPAELVEGMLPFAMLNADKAGTALKGILGELKGLMDTRMQQSTQFNDAQQSARRQAVEDAKELAEAQKKIAEAQEKSAQAEVLKAQALMAQRQLLESAPAPTAQQQVAPQPPPPQQQPAPQPPPPPVQVAPPIVEPEPEPQGAPPEPQPQPTNGSSGSLEIVDNPVVPEEPHVPVLTEN